MPAATSPKPWRTWYSRFGRGRHACLPAPSAGQFAETPPPGEGDAEHGLEIPTDIAADSSASCFPATANAQTARPGTQLATTNRNAPTTGGAKRALLVGSSYNGLRGTDNDVRLMATVLERHGFPSENITRLIGHEATRKNILEKWERLIRNSSAADAVVIYYSGHGGYATPETDSWALPQGLPSHLQYLIPSDFTGTEGEWKGILDVEISRLLYRTTKITRNVTYIIDCCHSARLGRAPDASAPGEEPPAPKVDRLRLCQSLYADVWEKAAMPADEPRDLAGAPDFTADDYSNPDVVRIAAAAAKKSAWQHQGRDGEWVGIFTECLAGILPYMGNDTSWRNIILGVSGRVEQKFRADPQQPRSAGPDHRIPFSLNSDSSRALLAFIRDKDTQIQGGRVLGVEEGDEYTILPLEESVVRPMAYTAIVTSGGGFSSTATRSSIDVVPDCVVALAYPHRQRNPWPIAMQGGLEHIRGALERSTMFRIGEQGDECVAEFRLEEGNIVLYGRDGTVDTGIRRSVPLCLQPQRANQADIGQFFQCLEAFVRAQKIISLESGTGTELFRPRVEIEVRPIESRAGAGGVLSTIDNEHVLTSYTYKHPLIVGDFRQPPQIELVEDTPVYIAMRNLSKDESSQVFVTVIAIDATGTTTVMSRAYEKGIPLSYETPYVKLRTSESGREGLPINWPEPVPRHEPVHEYFVFVVTKKEVDLRFLDTIQPTASRQMRSPREGFSLEPDIPYCIRRLRYTLVPKEVPADPLEGGTEHRLQVVAASELPSPGVVSSEPESPLAKGSFGAAVRFFRGVPAHIRVVNQHTEDIAVVVSMFRPRRLLAGAGMEFSPTGGGLHFNTTSYLGPATTKTLAPECRDPDKSKATFPIGTRKDGFGVVSIFTGADKVLYIENDRVPAGATAYFTNRPDLRIVRHGEERG